jgi:hypothetical protein
MISRAGNGATHLQVSYLRGRNGRIQVQDQPRQKSKQNFISKSKLVMVIHTYNPAKQETEVGGLHSEARPWQKV